MASYVPPDGLELAVLEPAVICMNFIKEHSIGWSAHVYQYECFVPEVTEHTSVRFHVSKDFGFGYSSG
jgi:hypothetical protein